MAVTNFALLFWPLQDRNVATFSLIIFNILALKFLYYCSAPRKNCSKAVENTVEGLLFSLESLVDKTNNTEKYIAVVTSVVEKLS